jgi:antitoxin YefM
MQALGGITARRLSVTEARHSFLKLAESLERDPREVVGITRRGRPVMALVSAELYESLVETLDILADEAEAARLRRALHREVAGKEGGTGRRRRRQP